MCRIAAQKDSAHAFGLMAGDKSSSHLTNSSLSLDRSKSTLVPLLGANSLMTTFPTIDQLVTLVQLDGIYLAKILTQTSQPRHLYSV
jgi:hypothetical protein